jgi:hypothetical protein
VRSSSTPEDEILRLWYELGGPYARAGENVRRASVQGFVATCVVGSQVLLSAPLFGTAWAGLFAAAIPIVVGLLVAGGLFGLRRGKFLRKRNALSRAFAEKGLDADRPAAGGLGAYYDAQLVLLRSEYEFLRSRGTSRALRSARLFEETFGFTPEDPFECGPLNIAPDTPKMRALRERWEGRLAARGAFGGAPPPLGLREDLAYRVFPREMTVPLELATRSAYLGISCDLFRQRYGHRASQAPDDVRQRAEKDLKEYRALVRR